VQPAALTETKEVHPKHWDFNADLRQALLRTRVDAASKARRAETYGKLPLHFEVNQGQLTRKLGSSPEDKLQRIPDTHRSRAVAFHVLDKEESRIA